MRLKGTKPSPAMVVAIVALVFAVAGSALAGVATISVLSKKEKKQTRKIARNEIKEAAPGLAVGSALTAGNAARLDGLGSTAFLQTSSRGVALAGVRMSSTGTVLSYFNRGGGAPSVVKGGSGVYTITFPGLTFNVDVQLAQAVLVASAGEIDVDSVAGGLRIDTRNSSGTLTDKGFAAVVFGGSSGG